MLSIYCDVQEEEFENYIKSENAGWSLNDADGELSNPVELQPRVSSKKSIDAFKNLEKNDAMEGKVFVQPYPTDAFLLPTFVL